MSQADWAPPVKQWFPHLTDTRLRQVTWPDFDKHREYVVEMLRAGVTKATIHQRLRDEHQVAGSLASFKRYVAANLAEDAVREKVTVLRADPEPGLEGQIDYCLSGFGRGMPAVRRRREPSVGSRAHYEHTTVRNGHE